MSSPRERAAPQTVPLLEDLHFLGALSGATAIVLAITYPAWGAGLHLLCPLRELTGVPCPTCFGTRATLALIGGDWRAALRLNPLVTTFGAALLLYTPWSAATVAFSWPRPRLSGRAIARTGWGAAGLVALNWIYLVVAHG